MAFAPPSRAWVSNNNKKSGATNVVVAGDLGRVERAVVRAAAGLMREAALDALDKDGVVDSKLDGGAELRVLGGEKLVQLRSHTPTCEGPGKQ